MLQKFKPKDPVQEQGLTLIELLIVIGILAIIAAIAVPNWVSQIQQENRSEAVYNTRSAIQQLYSMALITGGASITVTNNSDGTIYTIQSTASTVSATDTVHAPNHTVLYLGLNPISCFSLNGQGFPVNTADCNLPSAIQYPLSWSAAYAGQTIPITVK